MTSFYVDGKTGNDGNAGTIGSPVATIAHAASLLAAPGDKVIVVGYNDYVYRERPLIGGFVVNGTSGSPYVFEASGYVAGGTGYIKPIVDGSALVDVATYGSLSWTRPDAGGHPNVWATPWPTALSYGDTGAGRVDYTVTERADRAWLNTSGVTGYSIPLRRPLPGGGAGTAPTLTDLDTGYSYFFDRWSGGTPSVTPGATPPGGGAPPATGVLYVNISANSTAAGNPAYPTPSSTDPTLGGNTLEMPYESTFAVDNATTYLTIHGFRVWHGDLGISVKGGSTNVIIEDNDCSYNFDCGIILQGGGVGTQVVNCTVRRNSGTGNSIQMIKLDGYTQDCLLDSNDGYQNYLQSFVDVVGAFVHDIAITGNRGRDGNLVPDYTRYSPPSNGQIWGMVLEDGCYNIYISGNEFCNNSNGIGTYVPGANQFTGIRISGNYLHNNTVRGTVVGTGYGISFGSGDTGAIVFTGNHCPGNAGPLHHGIWFGYITTGKTVAASNDLLLPSDSPAPPPSLPESGTGAPASSGMQILVTHDAPDWFSGLMSGCWLSYDTYASPITGYPALVPLGNGILPAVPHNGGVLLSSAFVTANGGNTWTVHNRYLTTDTAADYLEFTSASTAVYIDVVTVDHLLADMVDSRGLVWEAYADGDAGQNTTDGPVFADQIRNGTVITISVDGTIVTTVDTSAGLLSTRIQLDGLGTHVVRVTNTGSTSTPTTDVHRCTVVGIVTTQTAGGGTPSWTSPVYDGGDVLATWIGADWEQAAIGTVSAVAFAVGNTPAPDGSWATYMPPVVETVPTSTGTASFTQEGVPHGRAGFLSPEGTIVRGRYAQVTLTLAIALTTPTSQGSTVPWVRSLEVFTSIPEADTIGLLRLPPILRGPNVIALVSARGAVLARLHADATELVGSYSIGSARGRWLQQIGRDMDLPQAPGEGQEAYAARLQAELAGKAGGPSAAFIAAQVGAYIGGTVTVGTYGSTASPWHYTLVIPPSWSLPVSRDQITTFSVSINAAGNIQALQFSS